MLRGAGTHAADKKSTPCPNNDEASEIKAEKDCIMRGGRDGSA